MGTALVALILLTDFPQTVVSPGGPAAATQAPDAALLPSGNASSSHSSSAPSFPNSDSHLSALPPGTPEAPIGVTPPRTSHPTGTDNSKRNPSDLRTKRSRRTDKQLATDSEATASPFSAPIAKKKNLSSHQRWGSGPYGVPQPAAFADLGPDSSLPPQFEADIQELAETVAAELQETGEDPATPAYHNAWAQHVEKSDFHLRQRYGGAVWSAHHIQAHHIAAGNFPNPSPSETPNSSSN